jgi:hypothetical protein
MGSRFLRDMRGDAGLPEISGELGRVEALVRAKGQLPRRSGGMAMDHVEGGALFRMIVRGDLIRADGHAERRTEFDMVYRYSPELTLGAYKGYDAANLTPTSAVDKAEGFLMFRPKSVY